MSDTKPEKKTVALVGHCGPDSSFLRMAVGSGLPGAKVVMADNEKQLDAALDAGVDLLLFNRVLEFGFDERQGQALLERVRRDHPGVATMMVSNYADAQEKAVAAGASPGFGKNDIGQPIVSQRLQAALGGNN